MDLATKRNLLPRKDGRVIIHFDYDCFYASVFEAENPALKSLPLAVQQKHIIVTCNYEARRRGLYKLQLITEARRLCPEVIIVLGEDISRFRDASKDLYRFLKKFSWNQNVEKLGFDEVWLDVTDVVDYNLDLLNPNVLEQSFFQIARDDPTEGFAFDATSYAGHVYPAAAPGNVADGPSEKDLAMRLKLGSHFAMHLRHQLEHEKGYTATVGISTNKLLSKLVGNLNKPIGQTTLIPPYDSIDEADSNVMAFMDGHDIGKVPNIGFKMAQKLREHVLERPAEFSFGLVYGGTKEKVTVRDVRLHQDVGPEILEKLFAGPGAPHGIGSKTWALMHGIDDTEVGMARPVPRQISIEDSYIRLDTVPEVMRELNTLGRSLINRMRIDLLCDDDGDDSNDDTSISDTNGKKTGSQRKKWLAHPKTLRLSTRPKPPVNADGTRTRTFKRISHSAPLPQFVFSLSLPAEGLAEKLAAEHLFPMFRKLHPEKHGWNVSLVNIAVTNMAEAAGESRTARGRDIGSMFRNQENVLKDFRVVDDEGASPAMLVDELDDIETESLKSRVNGDRADGHMNELVHGIDSSGDDDDAHESDGTECSKCGLWMPAFALAAHQRYHDMS